ncbi:MAG: hypothetical protein EA425_09135 [Puniceicoccaceae bacterium]|nr:MAG: hypothetical protein EA425_09135 [Puniceicoccaceae bacterium]
MTAASFGDSLAAFVGPFARWAAVIDADALLRGEPLRPKLLKIGRELGLRAPEANRILVVDVIPFPHHDSALVETATRLGLIGPGIRGNAQVFGGSILSTPEFAASDEKMAHELVHLRQIERAGSFESFLRCYLEQVRTHGYHDAPYEVEAYAANERYAEPG